jgi:DNA-binding beta-propeller fold protein YncE
MKKIFFGIGCIIFLMIPVIMYAQAVVSDYKISNRIPLTGDGWWDYMSVDEINRHLFVSHGTQVNVVDLRNGKQIDVIPDTKGVHGIALDYDANKGFISNGRDSSVTVFDLKSFDFVAKVKIPGKNPDAILYDPFSKKVFTFNGGSKNATVLDPNALTIVSTIPLSGKPEFAQTDGKGKIYVNIEDKNTITVINSASLKVENEFPITLGEEPTGLALDNENHRLFSACSNKIMTVIDAITGKVITTVPIGDGCDGVAFDPVRKCLYTSNGEGTMTVIRQESADNYKVSETFVTQPGARTIAIDKTTHHMYLSVASYEPGKEDKRTVKPNTFCVLDIEPIK